MSTDTELAPQFVVGAQKDKAGGWDFSHAAVMITTEEAISRVRDIKFQEAINNAAANGLTEDRMRALVNTFSSGDNDKPINRRTILAEESQRLGIKPDQVLSHVRNYKKEKTRLSEKGELHHYHQTSFAGFASGAEMGGLMPHANLETIGKLPKGRENSVGARPDVIQMTRDSTIMTGN